MKINTIPIRADPNFYKALKDLKIIRIQKGKDNILKPIKTARITLAMTRHFLFPKIVKDISEADLK